MRAIFACGRAFLLANSSATGSVVELPSRFRVELNLTVKSSCSSNIPRYLQGSEVPSSDLECSMFAVAIDTFSQ